MKPTVAIVALSALALTACGGGDSKEASSPSKSTTASSSTAPACKALSPSTPDSRAAAGAKLDGGLKVAAVQEIASSADAAKRDVIVRVCGASTTGDELKAQAQKIGLALKGASDATSIASVRVTNLDKPGDEKARLRSEDFQVETYEGAEGTERATWKTADES